MLEVGCELPEGLQFSRVGGLATEDHRRARAPANSPVDFSQAEDG